MARVTLGTVIEDTVHGVSYRLFDRLGSGGFGDAYLACEVDSDDDPIPGTECCLKLSIHDDEWHGEVYFSNLLRGQAHVVQMLSAFPAEARVQGKKRVVFAIQMEYIQDGTVRDLVMNDELPWTEEQIRRRVRLLLEPLAVLHDRGISHRDVTPANVFVAPRKVLKLGDFGITKAQLKVSGVHADALNPYFAPRDLGTFWRPADDVYQAGLLMATLASGELMGTEMGKVAVNQFTTKGKLRDAIKAAISPKSQRPQTARDMIKLLA